MRHSGGEGTTQKKGEKDFSIKICGSTDQSIFLRQFRNMRNILVVSLFHLLVYSIMSQFSPELLAAYEAYNKGVQLQRDGNGHDALEQYDIAIKLKPDFYQAYQNRGLCLENLGRVDDAILSHQLSVTHATSDDFRARAITNLANVISTKGRQQGANNVEAINILIEAHQMYPTDEEIMFSLGRLYYESQLFSQAKETFQKVRQYHVSSPRKYTLRVRYITK